MPIGDRESDIYELHCRAQDLGTDFLVRSCVDRLAEGGDTTIAQVMKGVVPSGAHRVGFRGASGRDQDAVLSVKFATMVVRPPIGKQKRHPYPAASDHPRRGDRPAGGSPAAVPQADHQPRRDDA